MEALVELLAALSLGDHVVELRGRGVVSLRLEFVTASEAEVPEEQDGSFESAVFGSHGGEPR